MSSKNDTEVIIDGKIFTLSGYETKDYLQKVASYINGKISEFKKSEGFKNQSAEVRSTLVSLNIADDYFKAKKQADALESDVELKDKQIYEIIKDKSHIVIANKFDLLKGEFVEEIPQTFKISAFTKEGLEELKEEIKNTVLDINPDDMEFVTNQRQQHCLYRAKTALENALGKIVTKTIIYSLYLNKEVLL